MIDNETRAIAHAGRPAARAAARKLATHARSMLSHAEEILGVAGDNEAAVVAREAGEAATRLLSATFDGPNQVFACRRDS